MVWCSAAPRGTMAAMRASIEEALRAIEAQAAMLRYLTDIASASAETLDPLALGGISETCEDIEETTRAIRVALSVEALARPLGSDPRA